MSIHNINFDWICVEMGAKRSFSFVTYIERAAHVCEGYLVI